MNGEHVPGRFVRLSRAVAHALRHRPERYGLELDKDGWADLDGLVRAIAREPEWAGLEAEEVLAMMAAAQKQRFELRNRLVRALYSHSLTGKIERAPAVPPDRLFHGTSSAVLAKIRCEGLKPMRRQYVHLSADVETAAAVAKRRTATPAIITVLAKEAHHNGLSFYRGSESVWLADGLPGRYLSLPDSS